MSLQPSHNMLYFLFIINLLIIKIFIHGIYPIKQLFYNHITSYIGSSIFSLSPNLTIDLSNHSFVAFSPVASSSSIFSLSTSLTSPTSYDILCVASMASNLAWIYLISSSIVSLTTDLSLRLLDDMDSYISPHKYFSYSDTTLDVKPLGSAWTPILGLNLSRVELALRIPQILEFCFPHGLFGTPALNVKSMRVMFLRQNHACDHGLETHS